MTLTLHTFFLLCAAVCFFLKAISTPTGRIDLLALGFFFVVLAVLFS